MLSTLQSEYGLEVTHNSKAGYAFSLPRSKTCIYKTDACAKACYGNGIRYQSDGQKRKRARNFKTVEFLLDRGGPALLAENLVILIDQARPIDWIASSITGIKTAVPWSLRLHDIGDVHSARYAQAWLLAVRQRPQCSLWFYTRSFPDDEIFEILTSLAAEPNCKGWLSLDRDNYSEGIIRYCEAPSGIWSIALLQEKEELMPSEVIPYLTCFTRAGDLLSFPKHHAGRHVTPMKANNLVVCPQITGSYKLEPAPNVAKPCQSCGHCLP